MGCVAVVAYQAVALLASVALNFSYQYASIGSFLIYVLVGVAAGHYASRKGVVVAGMVVGFVDATLGRSVSWLVGPGFQPVGNLFIRREILTILLLAMLAGFAAAVGAALETGQRREHREHR